MISLSATFKASHYTYPGSLHPWSESRAYARHTLTLAMYKAAEEVTGLPRETLDGPSRHRVISEARWALWTALYEDVGLSYPQIGRLRKPKPWDHTSILHGVRKVEKNPQLRETANQIINKARIMCGYQ